MAKIYISSTYSDLKEHREKVCRALRQMRHDVIAMEDYVARDERPLEACLADVAVCDIYIGIFAWRYGFIPSEDNPEGKSITELEYRKSIDTGKSPLIFLLDEQATWRPQLMDAFTGENGHGQRIDALRQELALKSIVSYFMTADELASLVGAAVSNWERPRNIQGSDDPSLRMQTKYLEQVYNYYSSVKLPVGPVEGFSLAAIFQPLTLRRDPLAAEDLERERRRFLLGESRKDDDGQQKHVAPHGMRPSLFMHELVQGTTVDNAEEALKRSSLQRIVILGGPGTGKTTTLKYLVASQAQKILADPNTPIPIFLSLAALTRSAKSLQSYLLDIVEDMEVDRDYAHVLWGEIQQGRAFVCLDSLDEVDPRQRGEVIDWINRKAAEPGNIWIIGSRFTEYKGGQFRRGQFIEWELQPMKHALRQELAHRLLPELQQLFSPAHRVPLIAAAFVRSLEHHPQAAAWCENPLLFSLAAIVYVKKGELPSSRTLLYQDVIEAILQMRESDPVRCELLLRMLTELALWLHQERGRTFTSTDLVTFFMDVQRQSWGAAPELIHQVINSGILEVVARHTYGFRHQTFQEYLSAVELVRLLTGDDQQKREATWKFIWSKRTYSRWVEVLRLMVGILIQRSGKRGVQMAIHWLQELLRQRATTEGDPGNLGLILALTSLGEIGEMVEWHTEPLIHLQKDIVSTWVEELLQASQNPYSTKAWRLQQLAHEVSFLHKNAVKVAVDHLLETLNHIFYSDKRTTAVGALGELGEWVPVEPLLEAALHDKDSSVRRAAARALEEQGERVPLELLLEALHDENWIVRWATAGALGELGERVPLEPLLEAALHDKDSNVREAAARALGELGERVPVEPLLEALHDEDSNVHRAAARALGELGERVPVEPLLEALHDEDSNVRREAAEALGEIGERVPLELLLEALHDENWIVRGAAVEALGGLGERVPLEPLLEAALHDEDSGVRWGAARALGGLGERVPLEPLLEAALHDENWIVRWAAVEALGRLGERVPVEPLLEVLHNEDSNVRWEAIKVLGGLGERVPLEPLLEALYDQDSGVRKAAVEALGKLGERVPVEPLLLLVKDFDRSVASSAIEVLKKRDPANLSPVITEARAVLQGQSPGEIFSPLNQNYIADVIGSTEVASPLFFDVLRPILNSASWQARLSAIRALGKIRRSIPDDIIRRLLELRYDPDPKMRVQREAADEALFEILSLETGIEDD